MAEHASGPPAVELTECIADARAAAEVVHAFAHRVKSAVEVAMAEQARDSRQPRREYKRLQVFPPRDGMGKDHQQSRVALHRAAHVADQHQGPPPDPRSAPEQRHQLSAGANRVSRRAPEVDAPRPSRPKAPRPPFRDTPRRLLEEPPHLLGPPPCHLFEVLVPEELLGAVATRARRELLGILLAAHLRGIEAK